MTGLITRRTSEEKAEHARRLDAMLQERLPGRPVLIGQAPSRRSVGWPAFFGGTGGKRLAALAGLGWSDLVYRTERFNVFDHFPGAGDGGDLFPMREARERAQEILTTARLRGRRVLFVGSAVAEAFRFDAPALTWQEHEGGFQAAVFPHPSGRNRYWNSRERTEQAAAFLRELLAS